MLDIPLQSGSGDPLIRGRFSKALELSSSSPGDPEIVALLEANISAGDPASMVLLGDVFSDGGSEQRSRSVELFREASRLGDASGTRNLAYCYAIGLNVAKDKAEAAKLYIAAGEMGNARAMCNIGVMYDYGNGVIQDRTAAFAWYVRSAQAGNKRGMTNLGEFYMLGKGTDRNLKLAAVWLERSGSPRALNAVGAVYDNGLAKTLHHGDVAKIHDKIVVSEAVATLREPHLAGSTLRRLAIGIDHILTAQKLSLLDVDNPARLGRCHEQIGLPAQEGRYLQDISHLARPLSLPRLVDIGQDAQLVLGLDIHQHLQPLVYTGAAI